MSLGAFDIYRATNGTPRTRVKNIDSENDDNLAAGNIVLEEFLESYDTPHDKLTVVDRGIQLSGKHSLLIVEPI